MHTLEIPELPRSINDWRRGSGHFGGVYTQERDRWRNLFALYGHRAARLSGPVRVCVTFYWAQAKRRDPDNHVKFVLDGAVRLGLIPEDGPPLLAELTLRGRLDRERPRTVFEYEPADAPAWPLATPRPQKRSKLHPSRSEPVQGHP